MGPSDLAASLGVIGQQTHPVVVSTMLSVFAAVHTSSRPVGVNAFDPVQAQSYRDAGAEFVPAGADVALLARGSEALAARYQAADATVRQSY